jgi:hypothetical protein
MHVRSAAEPRISKVDGERSLRTEHDAHEVVREVALRATRALTPRSGLARLAALFVLFALGHHYV